MVDFSPGTWTEIGSLPGDDAAYTGAVVRVLRDVPLPYVPELPDRPYGDMISRTLGVLPWAADLQPAGWRLTGGSSDARPGLDQRRAGALLRHDLEVVEEQNTVVAERTADWIKLAFAGPWTLAATVELPRGDKLLADSGAIRDVTDALAETVVTSIASLARSLGRRVLVQIDEPALPAVLTGAVPTISGRGRLRMPEPAEVADRLSVLTSAIRAAGGSIGRDAESDSGTEGGAGPNDAGAESAGLVAASVDAPVNAPVSAVHCCARNVPVALLRRAGFDLISLDLTRDLPPAAMDALGSWLEEESGSVLIAGVIDPLRPRSPREAADVVPAFAKRLGLVDATAARVICAPTCGMAAATPQSVRAVSDALRASADRLGSL